MLVLIHQIFKGTATGHVSYTKQSTSDLIDETTHNPILVGELELEQQHRSIIQGAQSTPRGSGGPIMSQGGEVTDNFDEL